MLCGGARQPSAEKKPQLSAILFQTWSKVEFYIFIYIHEGLALQASSATCSGELQTPEIEVQSGENTELKCSPFKAWSRSVYSHTCYTHCQGFLLCLLLPFRSIHLHFFQNLSWFFLCWQWLTHGSSVGLQNKIGHLAWGRCLCWVPMEYK